MSPRKSKGGASPRPDPLERYREKRSASRTPEPFGVVATQAPVAAGGGRLFVVQKHSATNLHWDFRLESGGVLLSWAVPKGPSPNPKDKRLAVHVEDHPLDYADFEGVIPDGEYGAGPVIVWDRGVWIALEDEREGLRKGKLLFELRGYKLRGKWTLVKTKQSEKSWLLIKERDGYVREESTEYYPDDSIYSGLKVEELESAATRQREIEARLAELGATKRRVDPKKVEILLATAREEPFSKKGWLFEIKYDGYRLVAGREKGEAVLVSRSGGDFTETFPDVARAVRGLPYDGLVVDGEVVVHDEKGLPSFGRLQRRGLLRKRADVARAALELPATYYAFDLLGFGDYDLRGLPLATRKEFLREVLPSVGPIRFSDHIEEKGEAMYAQVTAMGLEGVVAKKADSTYRGGRQTDWLKVRALTSDDFVIVGWTEPAGSRTGFGALHLAQWSGPPPRDGKAAGKGARRGRKGGARSDTGPTLRYRGSVGTGFDDRLLKAIYASLVELERDEPAFTGEVQESGRRGGKRAHHWTEPLLVCECRYREVTEQGVLRHPVFVRMRDDKKPAECVVPGGEVEEEESETAATALPEPARAPTPPPEPAARRDPPPRTIPFTNLKKVFWPELGLTKGDLIEYYRSVSEWLLPYLRDRPLVLTRYPDGIGGKSFYQKNAPEWAPDWIERLTLWSESSEREIEYFVVNDLESLLYLANLGTIPLHVWSSRVSSLGQPDWCILDLDPKEAPFEDVIAIARHIHELCEEIELPSFPKTSGSTGLHILIPLGRRLTYDQSRAFGELLARVVVKDLPDIATITRNPRSRGGKVYVDYLQNRHGQLLVAPFSARPVPEAAVSAPLKWSEVKKGLTSRAYTIESLPKRMRRLGEDPLAPVLEIAPDLLGALSQLSERLR